MMQGCEEGNGRENDRERNRKTKRPRCDEGNTESAKDVRSCALACVCVCVSCSNEIQLRIGNEKKNKRKQ